MALTGSVLGTAVFSTTAGSKAITATPAVGDLIVLVTAHSGWTSATAPTDNNSDGLGTYTLAQSAQRATNVDRMDVWIRDARIGSASSTVFTHNASTSTGGGMVIIKYTGGGTRAGSLAKVKSAAQNNIASGTPAVAMGSAIATRNAVLGCVMTGSNSSANVVNTTNYTERFDNGYNTPPTGLQVQTRDSGETASTITWGGAAASAFCSIVLEINCSPIMAAATTSFALSGPNAALKKGYRIDGQTAATFTLTGTAATLTYAPAPKILVADTAAFALSGTAASLNYFRRWTPDDSPGLTEAWYDYSDTANVNHSGSTLISVADKSQHGRTMYPIGTLTWESAGGPASQGVVDLAPGTPAGRLEAEVAPNAFFTELSFISVWKKTGSATTYNAGPMTRSTGTIPAPFDALGTARGLGNGTNSGYSGSYPDLGSDSRFTAWNILTQRVSVPGGLRYWEHINGTIVKSDTFTYYGDTGDNLIVGSHDAHVYTGTMRVGEQVAINAGAGSLSYMVEGYLAWKWGLVSLLDAGHAYKSAPPLTYIPPGSKELPAEAAAFVATFTAATLTKAVGPKVLTALSGSFALTGTTPDDLYYGAPWDPRDLSAGKLVAWWDYSDASTVSHSGTTLTSVTDKTGSGYVLTPSSSAATYLATSGPGSKGIVDLDQAKLTAAVEPGRFPVRLMFASVWKKTGTSTAAGAGPISRTIGVEPAPFVGLNTYRLVGDGVNQYNWSVYPNLNTDSRFTAWNILTDEVDAATEFLRERINGTTIRSDSFGYYGDNADNITIGNVEDSSYTAIMQVGEQLACTGLNFTDLLYIEAYLAWKWGLQGSLDPAHPFDTVRPLRPGGPRAYTLPGTTKAFTLTGTAATLTYGTPHHTMTVTPAAFALTGTAATLTYTPVSSGAVSWTPAYLPRSKLQGWWDISEAATVTHSGTTLTSVADKSGKGRTMTAYGSITYQASGGPGGEGVAETTSGGYLEASVAAGTFPTEKGLSFVSVWKVLGSTTYSASPMNRTGPTQPAPYDGWGTNRYLGNGGANSSVSTAIDLASASVVTAWNIFSSAARRDPVYRYEERVNGTVSAGASFDTNYYIDAGNLLTIGSRADHVTTTNARFGEHVAATELSPLEQAQIEGYLAWKWGQEALLPSGHRYKSAEPEYTAGITFLDSVYAVNSSSSAGATSAAIDTTGADFLLVASTHYMGGAITLSDSMGNTWTALAAHDESGGDPRLRFYYCTAPATNAAHTFSFTGSPAYGSIGVSAWSGVHQSSPIESENVATVTDGISTSSVTPAQNGSLLVSFFGGQVTSGLEWTGPIEFSTIISLEAIGSVSYAMGIAYSVQTTAAATVSNWSWIGAIPDVYVVDMLVVKPAVTAPTGYTLTAASGSFTLTGTAVTLRVTMPVTTQSYALSGTAVTFKRGIRMPAATQGYTLSGTAVTLRVAMPAATQGYALNGTAVTFKRGLRMPAATTNFTLSGTDVTFKFTRRIIVTNGAFLLVGVPASLDYTPLNDYILNADSGLFVFAGPATALRVARKFTAAPQTYVLTGTAVTLRVGMPATPQTYVLTGTAVTFKRGLKMPAATQGYTLTGTAVTFKRGLRMPAATQGYALSGTAVTFKRGLRMPVTSINFTTSGTDVTFRFARRIIAASASYVLTWTPASLNYNPLFNYILNADPGSFNLTGTAVSLRTTRRLVATPQTYSLTGTAAALNRGRYLAATTQSYLLTGTAANLKYGRRMVVTTIGFTLSGTAVTFRLTRRLAATSASYLLTGAPVSLDYTPANNYILNTTEGIYTLSGTAATLRVTRRLVAATTSFALSGTDVRLLRGRYLAAATRSYALTGTAANLKYGRRMAVDTVGFVLVGTAVSLAYSGTTKRLPVDPALFASFGGGAVLTRTWCLKVQSGSFLLAGKWTNLVFSAAPPVAKQLYRNVTVNCRRRNADIAVPPRIAPVTRERRNVTVIPEPREVVLAPEERNATVTRPRRNVNSRAG